MTDDYKKRLDGVLREAAEAARRAGRDPGGVAVVAVSKRHPASSVASLAGSGHDLFGESYAQEALEKMEELGDIPNIRWHFIGGLQSNKAKYVGGRFELIHSVDTLKLAGLLDKAAQGRNVLQPVLLQVNLAGEEQKSGVAEADLEGLARAVENMDNLRLDGLMVMPPFFDDPERSRPFFSQLRQLRDRLSETLGRKLPHLSMGMTNDFPQAVEEGATLIRVGTRIFGPRPCSLLK